MLHRLPSILLCALFLVAAASGLGVPSSLQNIEKRAYCRGPYGIITATINGQQYYLDNGNTLYGGRGGYFGFTTSIPGIFNFGACTQTIRSMQAFAVQCATCGPNVYLGVTGQTSQVDSNPDSVVLQRMGNSLTTSPAASGGYSTQEPVVWWFSLGYDLGAWWMHPSDAGSTSYTLYGYSPYTWTDGGKPMLGLKQAPASSEAVNLQVVQVTPTFVGAYQECNVPGTYVICNAPYTCMNIGTFSICV